MAYDSFTEGVYKFEKYISIDPEIVQDKNIKIVGVGTWKEKPENEYEKGFEVFTRVNPLLYQLNSDDFLNQLPGANIIWDINDGTGDKWPKLCVENFNNLIGK
ncbi:hypothetical protein [Algoriphagus boritolerans]|uniref:Uncharacterized protein n=1 Tax=Algoriphagus boritolerans DSM 17298 = JCM 18970 TaxID=1120964 RepID=A0A1H6AFY0_9BACT|nr:hypothetical protein [Algoriphagus boritolerans]SEG47618.1 hypothetical protein SAMN03080598_04120 [Algoriphagus boritolerans DSM 17298 = JCM 18970]